MCGYSLLDADGYVRAVYSKKKDVQFLRVLDLAGALTHDERSDLTKALLHMERSLPPIVLGICITNYNQASSFRPFSHWILNRVLDEEQVPPAAKPAPAGKKVPPAPELSPGSPGSAAPSWWQRLCDGLRDVAQPYQPRPVEQKWMLMLVLNVELEMACFSWGYMLDPYINPDRINSCILRARLQFRERAMAMALKKVMRAAVRQIAAQSHRVNRQLKIAAQLEKSRASQPPRPFPRAPLPLLFLGSALCLAPSALEGKTTPAPAPAPAAALPAADSPWADDESAEDAEEVSPAAVPAPPPAPAGESGAAASAGSPPRWAAEDYRHLLSGELSGAYKLLLTPPAPASPHRAAAPAPGGARANPAESDTKVPKIYHSEYAAPAPDGIVDPQHLLSSVQYADLSHVLRLLNARSRYRLYVAVFKQGQELPVELAVGTLVRTVAKPGEYSVMMMFGLGDSPQAEIGFYELRPSEEERLAWLERVRRAAQKRAGDGGVESLIDATRELHACLAPMAAKLPALSAQGVSHVPLIPIKMREDDKEEKLSLRDEIRLYLQDASLWPIFVWVGSIIGGLLLFLVVLLLRRRSGRLYKTVPDERLSSPHGAGVSRCVRYLEGTEVPPETTQLL